MTTEPQIGPPQGAASLPLTAQAVAVEPVTDEDTRVAMQSYFINMKHILIHDRRRVAERQAARPLEKIDRDESYGRSYIPVAPGWEVQTKGKGSTFRLCEPSGDRLAVPDSPYLHATIERMALAIHAHRVAMEEEVERLRAEVARLTATYNELLYAVGSKYPDETRHQTALRYIQQQEQRGAILNHPCAAKENSNG